MKKQKSKQVDAGKAIGFSPYRQDVSMTRAPSVRDLNRRSRKQAKRDCRDT